MTCSVVLPYVITLGILIIIGYLLARILRSVRHGSLKSGSVGLAMAMLAILSIFRDNTPKDKTKITRTTSNKSDLDDESLLFK